MDAFEVHRRLIVDCSDFAQASSGPETRAWPRWSPMSASAARRGLPPCRTKRMILELPDAMQDQTKAASRSPLRSIHPRDRDQDTPPGSPRRGES